ncbi:alpha/beta fold hydrolase [Novosphingobium sp. BL-52-GroH]|uniref:alpha/beta fold hydrolase n=1 Tax=Novosphingobium sp. BL-52-GroH TaxID=3349877 RepID=UPI00385163A5
MTTQPSPSVGIDRHFVQIDGRNVHYLRGGEGPPLLLIHPSPYNATFWNAAMAQWGRHYTCIAPDSPGFGLSDPLSPEDMSVDGLTRAIGKLVTMLDLKECRLVGSHTGAAIALELAVRHSDRFTGVALEAVPLFTATEQEEWFTDAYFSPLRVSEHGEHLTWAWTRVRDADVYFPWLRRQPSHFYNVGRGSAAKLHQDVIDYYECARHFRPAYRSAVGYADQAVQSLAALELPALIYASSADVMASHIDRLPPLKAGQRGVGLGTDAQEIIDTVNAALASFGGGASPPDALPFSPDPVHVAKRIVEVDGQPVLVRQIGDAAAPGILLLHDAPGSAATLEPLMRAMMPGALVLAPDLPGCGSSAPLSEDADLSAYAAWLDQLCDTLGLATIAVHAVGFGASLALAFQAHAPGRVTALSLDGLFAPEADERADLLASYAPAIAVKDNGSHWYDLWLMLRDSLTMWPWYGRTADHVRAFAEPCSPDQLHDWTVEVMKQFGSYHRLPNAALAQDIAPLLQATTVPVTLCDDPAHRFSVYRDKVQVRTAARLAITRDPAVDGPALRAALIA